MLPALETRRSRRGVVVLVGVMAGAAVLGRPSPACAADPLPDPAPPRLRVGLRASAGVDLASLPAAAPGAEIALVLLYGAHRVELLGASWLPEPASFPAGGQAGGQPGAGAQISLLTAGARYCRALADLTIGVAVCAGLEAGARLAHASGTAAPASSAVPWVAPGLRLLGLWNVSPSFAFTAGLDGLLPVARSAFTLAGVGPLPDPPPLSARALLGLEAHFR